MSRMSRSYVERRVRNGEEAGNKESPEPGEAEVFLQGCECLSSKHALQRGGDLAREIVDESAYALDFRPLAQQAQDALLEM